jgi:hypothetical protein
MPDKRGHASKPPSKAPFGKLNRAEPAHGSALSTSPTPARKRSAMIALVALGTGAVGLLAVANAKRCQPADPTQPPATCRTSSGGSGGFGSYSGSSSSRSASTTVERGGFGRTGASLFGRAGA